MKCTPEIYARALSNATAEAKPAERANILRRFVRAVAKRGDARKLPAVLAILEYQAVHARGGRMITIETTGNPKGQSFGTQRTVLWRLFKPADHIETREAPELIAGARIVIDGEREIDFSLARRLKKIFL